MDSCVFFQAPFSANPRVIRTNPGKRSTAICSINRDDEGGVRFRKESIESVRTSFKAPQVKKGLLSPNERILQEVQDTMKRLGVTEKETPRPAPNYKDYSHVKPLSAFAGAAGSTLVSAALWKLLVTLVALYSQHPFDSDFYVVTRLVAVVRTAVVGLLSLASGISGVTGVGLFLLGARVSTDAIQDKLTK